MDNSTKMPHTTVDKDTDCARANHSDGIANGNVPKRTSSKNDVKPLNSSDIVRGAPIPPDGGWGWVVTFSSFMMGVLVDGICFTFGFFFKEFQDHFGSNKSVTSSISSVLNGTYLTIGPVAGALVNRFGCKKVAIFGSILSSVAFFTCTFSPNIESMIVLYGFVGGLGFGCMYLPAIVMVGYYFDKRRALATGIAVCGSGVGSFIFAPLCELLLAEFDWKGAMWIISAILLNGAVFASLYRPLEYSMETFTEEDVHIDSNGITSDKACVGYVCHDENSARAPVFKSAAMELKYTAANQIYRCRSLETCSINTSETKQKINNVARLGNSLFLDSASHGSHQSLHEGLHHRHVLSPLARKDIFYSGSVHHLPQYAEAGNEEKYVASMPSDHELDNSSESEDKRTCSASLITGMFDFSLLKSITFDLYCLSCFLCMLGFFVPFIYLPVLARDLGLSTTQGTWLISTVGILNSVGRIAVGYVSDKPWADCVLINTVTLILAGTITMFVPFYKIYSVMIIYTIIFGISIAAFVSLRSIIIVELLGIDKLTNSFGIVVLCQGLSSFIGSPVAGALSDATGDYKASFYLAGAVIALSGLLCLPLRRVSRWEKERAKNRQERGHGNDAESAPMLLLEEH